MEKNMTNTSFIYHIPTKVYFGDMLSHLGQEIIQYGKRVLWLYDGDYIKENGLYQKIIEVFQTYQIEHIEFRDIKPNPRHTDVNKAIQVCQENQIDVILAVGGGSVIDSAKVIAACAFYEGDCWDIVSGKIDFEKSLPVVAISTISATGSEMDNAAVISHEDYHEKRVLAKASMYPAVTFLDPTLTYTVGPYQSACGVADILSHILEEYFTPVQGMYMIDTIMEGLIRTVFKYGPTVVKEPTNYEARENMMWASNWAINGFVSFDRPHPWSMHPLGHQLSAYYDMTHGLSLAIIMPRWLRHILDEKSLPLFRALGQHALMLDEHLSDEAMAKAVIQRIETLLFEELKLKSHLKELNITDEYFEAMADKLCEQQGYHDGFRPLYKEDILSIYQQCL